MINIRKFIKYFYSLLFMGIGFVLIGFGMQYSTQINYINSEKESLKFDNSEIVINKNKSYQLGKTIYNKKKDNIKYVSSDKDVIEVNELTGEIVSKNYGRASVTAHNIDTNEIVDQIEVIVTNKNILIESLTYEREEVSLQVGRSIRPIIKYEPTTASVHDFTYQSSDEEVATVNEEGIVKGLKEGKAIIKAIDNSTGLSAFITVNVYVEENINDYEVALHISNDNVKLNIDGTQLINANVTPSTYNQEITWKSMNEEVATVDAGIIKGMSLGETEVVVSTINNIEKRIKVVVTDEIIPVTKIKIIDSNVSLMVGDTTNLNVTVSPSNSTNQSIIWNSSDTSIATISETGTIKGIKEGKVKIFATTLDGLYQDSIEVTIKKVEKYVEVNDLIIKQNDVTLNVGSSITVKTSIVPSDATNKKINWTTSDSKIVTVKNGLIYGVSEGSAVVTATTLDNNITKTIKVTVVSVPLERLEIKEKSIELGISEEKTIKVQYLPSNTTNKTLTWISNDPSIVSVNDKGVIKGITEGIGSVTVIGSNGYNEKIVCIVTYKQVAIKEANVKFQLDKNQVEIKKGGSYTFAPVSNSNSNITYTSSNPKIATVDSNGKVKGILEGVTKITATQDNDKYVSYVLVKSASSIKAKYLTGSTLKYWIDNSGSGKNYYVTHIWASDPYNQMKVALSTTKLNKLAQGPTIMKNEIKSKGYNNKMLVAVNASGFVNKSAGWDAELAKFKSSWNYSPINPLIIHDGNVVRNYTDNSYPNVWTYIYGLRKDGQLASYNLKNGSAVDSNKMTVDKIINDGVKYTYGFDPILVSDSKSKSSDKTNNMRQSVCQIDDNNFLFITNSSSNRSLGFNYKNLGKKMVDMGCITGFNLDGGGSINLLYKNKNSSSTTKILNYGRAIADMLYFVEK